MNRNPKCHFHSQFPESIPPAFFRAQNIQSNIEPTFWPKTSFFPRVLPPTLHHPPAPYSLKYFEQTIITTRSHTKNVPSHSVCHILPTPIASRVPSNASMLPTPKIRITKHSKATRNPKNSSTRNA